MSAIERRPAARETGPIRSEESRASYAARFKPLFSEYDFEVLLMGAYDKAKAAHDSAPTGRFRRGGQRQFDHPRASSILALDEIGIADLNVHIGILMHDTGEDTDLLGPHTTTNSQWIKVAKLRLEKDYNPEVAEIVLSLTRPFVDGQEVRSKQEAEEIHREMLKKASPEAILAEMSEKLHNLRTLGYMTPENQMRKMAETEEFYFPIFEAVAAEKYPRETALLLKLMKEAIAQRRDELEKMGPLAEIPKLDEYQKLIITQLVTGVDDHTTRNVYGYDEDLMAQTRGDLRARLNAVNNLDLVKKLLEKGLLTFAEVDRGFDTEAYFDLTGRMRKIVDFLIDPENDLLNLEQRARLLRIRRPKDLRSLEDSVMNKLKVRNKYQLLVLVYYCRVHLKAANQPDLGAS
ncbi:MAG: hypothetical protein M1405_01375 [Patescibacteria group bacterium]|nr:hypothetical protein [Patescibacteria group bacterium]